MSPEPVQKNEAFIRAQKLAEEGKFECRGPCGRVKDEKDGVAVHYQGVVVLAVCVQCFLEVDVVLQRTSKGIEVKMKPREIIVVRP